MAIEIITHATPELESFFARVIPQLSSSSAPMKLQQLENMLAQDSLTLIAFRADEASGSADTMRDGAAARDGDTANDGGGAAYGKDAAGRDGERPLLGMLSLIMFEIPTGWRAWIEDVVVDDAARGRGAGKALVNAAVKIARDKGAKSVDLTSRPSREAANRLYRRAGFELRETNVYRYNG